MRTRPNISQEYRSLALTDVARTTSKREYEKKLCKILTRIIRFYLLRHMFRNKRYSDIYLTA